MIHVDINVKIYVIFNIFQYVCNFHEEKPFLLNALKYGIQCASEQLYSVIPFQKLLTFKMANNTAAGSWWSLLCK